MTVILYQTRSARVTVQPPDGPGIEVENLVGNDGLRITFDVRRALDTGPDEGTATIYNLGPDQLGLIEGQRGDPGGLLDLATYGDGTSFNQPRPPGPDSALADNMSTVTVEAGYNEQVSTIFESVLAEVRSVKPDNITTQTTIKGTDNLDGALFNASSRVFADGSLLFSVVDELRTIAGLGQGNFTLQTWAALVGNATISGTYAITGDCYTQLDEVFEYLRSTDNLANVRWFQDAGDFYVYRDDQFVTDGAGGEAPLELPPLKKRPARESSGYIAVTSFLAPQVRPGRLVVLDPSGLSPAQLGDAPILPDVLRSDIPPGLYRCDEVRHTGDTNPGGRYTTVLKLWPTSFGGLNG